MNRNVFSTNPGKLILPADTTNLAGGKAYSRSPEESLAQFAATGCFGDTFYAQAGDQLKDVLALADQCSPEWIAKCAIYAREKGLMKDMPAMLCAVLAKKDVSMLKRVFSRCIDNGKMLRNFVQIVRSGVTGRKSFGTAVKRLIRQWFEVKTDEALFHSSIGDKPSLGDIVKMVHPKPKDEARRMMLAYLMGKEVAAMGLLPDVVQKFEAAKKGETQDLPDINFQFLSSLTLKPEQWAAICDRASWQTLRMNLNTFQRHGCFADIDRLSRAIERLRSREEIKRARPMPHQLFSAFLNVADDVPPGIKMALSQAVETSLENIPKMPDRLVIGVDVSGSMKSAITGARGSATSKVRCVDVAALFACAILKTTPTAGMVAFDTTTHQGSLGGSVTEAAARLAAFGGGGTNCSLPVIAACTLPRCDAVVLISDNESWVDGNEYSYGYGTSTMAAFRKLQQKNPNVKMVCIDLTPSKTRQASVDKNIINVGGFSDAVFEVIATFLSTDKSWTTVISEVAIG